MGRLTNPPQHITRIPMNRIAVMIGKNGTTRKSLEDSAGARLFIDSDTGDVSIQWNTEVKDPVKMMKMPDVIRAIGRGMPPKKAIPLLENDDLFMEIIDLRDWVGKRGNQLRRLRSRLIGRNGRIRGIIEQHTGCELSIHGHTATLIGLQMGMADARSAIEMIINGSEHSTVIRTLEQRRKRRREARKMIDYIEVKDSTISTIDALVPGLHKARSRQRRLKKAQVNPEDEQDVEEMIRLKDDEASVWAEE